VHEGRGADRIGSPDVVARLVLHTLLGGRINIQVTQFRSPVKENPPGGVSRAGRLDRRGGSGGGSADLGAMKLGRVFSPFVF